MNTLLPVRRALFRSAQKIKSRRRTLTALAFLAAMVALLSRAPENGNLCFAI